MEMDDLTTRIAEIEAGPDQVELPEGDFEPPSYSDPGWILVEIITTGLLKDGGWHDYELGETATDGAAFWIVEEEGLEHWLDGHLRGEITDPGWYVIEDVIGTFSRGDGYSTDDDVDWEFASPRKATEDEIDSLHVATPNTTAKEASND
jgi:hypothetical protein